MGALEDFRHRHPGCGRHAGQADGRTSRRWTSRSFWCSGATTITPSIPITMSTPRTRLCQRLQRRPPPAPDHAADVVELQPDRAVDLGTIAAYDISPVMMELFGLRSARSTSSSLAVSCGPPSRANTRGTIHGSGRHHHPASPPRSSRSWSDEHWLLQYDLMFGKGYALSRMGVAGLSGMDTGK